MDGDNLRLGLPHLQQPDNQMTIVRRNSNLTSIHDLTLSRDFRQQFPDQFDGEDSPNVIFIQLSYDLESAYKGNYNIVLRIKNEKLPSST